MSVRPILAATIATTLALVFGCTPTPLPQAATTPIQATAPIATPGATTPAGTGQTNGGVVAAATEKSSDLTGLTAVTRRSGEGQALNKEAAAKKLLQADVSYFFEAESMRLPASAFDRFVAEHFGFTEPLAQRLWPEDPKVPFTHIITRQIKAASFVDTLLNLGEQVADAFVARSDIATALGCTPTGPNDSACLKKYTRALLQQAFRRQIPDAEVDATAALALERAAFELDFLKGVKWLVMYALQHPEFLHVLEIVEPIAGDTSKVKLAEGSRGTLMSLFLLGTTPGKEYMKAVLEGQLEDDEGCRQLTEDMLKDAQVKGRVKEFHAYMLGYSNLSGSPLAAAMRAEADAMVEKVALEPKTPWTDILLLSRTTVSSDLARHYGWNAGNFAGVKELDVPAEKNGALMRAGILGTAAYLSGGVKPGATDTSPVLRSVSLQERLLCTPPPPVPDDLVDEADALAEVDPSACKPVRYAAHRSNARCAGCHANLDPVGFGLENFNATGQFITTEKDKPECKVAGTGVFPFGDGTTEFSGPAALAQLLVAKGKDGVAPVEECLTKQIVRFATGRKEAAADGTFFKKMALEMTSKQKSMIEVAAEFACSPTMKFRKATP